MESVRFFDSREVGNKSDERLHKMIELATGITIPDEEEQEQRINFTNEILRLADEKEIDLEEITTKFKVDGISDMTTEQMKKCIVAMQKKEV